MRLANLHLFYQRGFFFSTHSCKLFGTTGIARGIRLGFGGGGGVWGGGVLEGGGGGGGLG